jgi:hypothetical protein
MLFNILAILYIVIMISALIKIYYDEKNKSIHPLIHQPTDIQH